MFKNALLAGLGAAWEGLYILSQVALGFYDAVYCFVEAVLYHLWCLVTLRKPTRY